MELSRLAKAGRTGQDTLDLLELIRKCCVTRGEVKLAAGAKSDVYIDLKSIITSGVGATLIGGEIFYTIRYMNIDAVGGPEAASIALVTATTMTALSTPPPLKHHLSGFFVRKQVKEHGLQKMIEGDFEPGYRVVLVEDVISTGTSILHAAREVKKAGGIVVAVVAVVNRLMGADAILSAENLPLYSVFTLDEIVES